MLVSREVVESAPGDDVSFNEIGPVPLKGLAQPVDLFRAQRVAG